MLYDVYCKPLVSIRGEEQKFATIYVLICLSRNRKLEILVLQMGH